MSNLKIGSKSARLAAAALREWLEAIEGMTDKEFEDSGWDPNDLWLIEYAIKSLDEAGKF